MQTQGGERPRFWGGKNIAMKVPPHQYAATVAFYRDTLGLPLLRQAEDSCGFELGPVELWIDRVETVSQAELWLQVETDNEKAAAVYLKQEGVTRCDAIEPLPSDYAGFWISSPAGIVHLVSQEGPG